MKATGMVHTNIKCVVAGDPVNDVYTFLEHHENSDRPRRFKVKNRVNQAGGVHNVYRALTGLMIKFGMYTRHLPDLQPLHI
jgi:hypothetical protein